MFRVGGGSESTPTRYKKGGRRRERRIELCKEIERENSSGRVGRKERFEFTVVKRRKEREKRLG